jgi:hypothetical protein
LIQWKQPSFVPCSIERGIVPQCAARCGKLAFVSPLVRDLHRRPALVAKAPSASPDWYRLGGSAESCHQCSDALQCVGHVPPQYLLDFQRFPYMSFREREIDRVQQLLASTRLLTLTGAGGYNDFITG